MKLNTIEIIISVWITFLLGLLLMAPTAALAACFSVAVCLFGLIQALQYKDTKELNKLKNDIKIINEKMDAVLISRGFGR